jgi:hypothetical protein
MIYNLAETPNLDNTSEYCFNTVGELELLHSPIKAPIQLSTDVSKIISLMQPAVEKAKYAQSIVDRNYSHEDLKKTVYGQILYSENKQQVRMHPMTTANSVTGYILVHEIDDVYGIYDLYADILKIPKESIYEYQTNRLELVHMKTYTTLPYHIHRVAEHGFNIDPVELLLPVSGKSKFWFSTQPESEYQSKYSYIMEDKITAFNPRLLHTGTALSEDSYLLAMTPMCNFQNILDLNNNERPL